MLAPKERPLTPDVGELAFENVPVPETTVQVPPPVVGALPASVADVAQTVWSVPALAVVNWSTVIVKVLE